MVRTHRIATLASAAFAAMHTTISGVYAIAPPVGSARPGAVSIVAGLDERAALVWAAVHAAAAVLLWVGVRRGPGLLVYGHVLGAAVVGAHAVAIILGGLVSTPARLSPAGLMVAALAVCHVAGMLMWQVARDRVAVT